MFKDPALPHKLPGNRFLPAAVAGLVLALTLMLTQQGVARADDCQVSSPKTVGDSVIVEFSCGAGYVYDHGYMPNYVPTTTYGAYNTGTCHQSAPQTVGNSVTVSFSCPAGYVDDGYWGNYGNYGCGWGVANCGNNSWNNNYWNNNYWWGNNYWNNNSWWGNGYWNQNVCYNWSNIYC